MLPTLRRDLRGLIGYKEGLLDEDVSEILGENLKNEGRHKEPDEGPEPKGKKRDGGRPKKYDFSRD
jgi:hypothetical protein